MNNKVTRDTPIGTKVRLIANTNASCNKVGDIGIITEHSESNDCRVDAGRRDSGNWSVYEELEIVSQFTDNYEIC